MPLSLKVKIKILLIFADKDYNDTQHGECVYISLKSAFLLGKYTIFITSTSVTNYVVSNNLIEKDTM